MPGKFEPYSKNPNLAKFFVQMARAEDLGTGINNVYTYLKLYAGTSPEFNEEQLFKVTIPLKQVEFNKKEDDKQLDMFNNECEGMCGV